MNNIYTLKDGTQISSIDIGKAKSIIIGEKKNRLTVCDRAPNTKSKKARVICLCDCGNYTVINHQDFKEGKVKSCGCLSLEQKIERCKKTAVNYNSIERNINPFYEYIEPTDMRYGTSNQIVWKIKCRKCNQEYFGPPNELISEKRSHGLNPCRCWQKHSIGVWKIIDILEKNKINYSLEKTFESCLSTKGNMLPFDFYLPDYNILIEYDGQQHYQIAFGQDEQKLFLQQENDKIKNNWCKENNIKLIRISYKQKNITLNDIIKGEQNIG